MKAELVPENGDPPIPIIKDLTVIGRREFCDVTIDHHSLSKRHCVVVKTDGLLIIRDLATTNGTKVKGQKIRWAALLPDDKIALGAYKLKVYLGPDNVPGPSEKTHVPRVQTRASVSDPIAIESASPKPSKSGPSSPPSRPAATRDSPPGSSNADLEILDDENSDDSGWRKLIDSRRSKDDMMIELD